jgi:uncharacterized protein YlbG (UPF0298 family)
MIHHLMYNNKQMRYQVVLLIQLNDVQQSMTKCKKNESTMDIKHASACALEFFSFFLLFFSFEQIATESK